MSDERLSPIDQAGFAGEIPQAGVQIRVLRPSPQLPDQIKALGLDELVMRGYEIDDPTIDPHELAMNEYDGAEDVFRIYTAMRDGKAVGSLSFILIPNGIHEMSTSFWQALETFEPELYARMHETDTPAATIYGLVTLPEERDTNTAEELVRSAVDENTPPIIMDQSKSPEDIHMLSTTLGQMNYRTFFGRYEVTPGQTNPDASDHLGILKAYLFARGVSITEDGTLPVEDEPTIKPTIPDTSGFPPAIAEAFEPVIQSQRNNPHAAMVSPLISVHRSLLPDS